MTDRFDKNLVDLAASVAGGHSRLVGVFYHESGRTRIFDLKLTGNGLSRENIEELFNTISEG